MQITKKAGSAGKLSCHLYVFQDSQINVSDAQCLNVVYSTNVGKTEYLLRILETKYENHFEFIVIMCPTILDNNKTYLSRKWIFDDKNVFIVCDVEGK